MKKQQQLVVQPVSQSQIIHHASGRLRGLASVGILLCLGVFLLAQYSSFTLHSYSDPLVPAKAMASIMHPTPEVPATAIMQQASKITPTPEVPVVHDFTIPPVVNGLAPVVSNFETTQPIVFLGIDDGANKKPFELALMQKNNVKASLFLADTFIKDNPAFFNDFTAAGSVIENHSVDHLLMSKMTYDQQKWQICHEADIQELQFGRRPILFRPPGGDYNLNTQRAAADCGMKAVVIWIAKANGGSMQYQIGNKLRPGDIVLMHFRPEFAQDMKAFLDAQNAAGLHTELLEDWLQ